ncbi:MAG: hypothetical protein K6G88_11125 [Lachnospiraceae bacterium]|nr:hypothetical protein [Lachnospiraceae bacterium]
MKKIVEFEIDEIPPCCSSENYICPFAYDGIWEHCSLQFRNNKEYGIEIQTDDNEAYKTCPLK